MLSVRLAQRQLEQVLGTNAYEKILRSVTALRTAYETTAFVPTLYWAERA